MITQTRAPQRTTPFPRGADLAAALRASRWPLALTALVLAAAVLGPSSLRQPDGEPLPAGAALEVGWGYIAMAPLTTLLDTLSLLTVGQHWAILGSFLLIWIPWRLLRRRRTVGPVRRTGIEAGAFLLGLGSLVGLYALGALAPRPMAALSVADPEIVIVDFHSHTTHSHDGRESFDADANREWHASAGFDVAYVSDHRTWAGFDEGAPDNPATAGEGTVLLSALEIKFAGKYASVLGPAWRYRHAVEGNHLLADSLYRALRDGGPVPTLVLTIPGGLDDVPAEAPGTIGYVAVEVSDASPKGLRQAHRDRAKILRMADSMNLALVASSNNHGWGRTAAAWTLMRIPGWRDMTPQRLGQAIERRLHRERAAATDVVERRMPWFGESPAVLTLTVPAITWQMLGGLGAAQRVSWLVWIWTIALLIHAWRSRRRGRRSETVLAQAGHRSDRPGSR